MRGRDGSGDCYGTIGRGDHGSGGRRGRDALGAWVSPSGWVFHPSQRLLSFRECVEGILELDGQRGGGAA
eukprot:scaffold133232_cov28-Tisochrysis_lutea.AAC.4